jgi:hypothetical protein
MIIRMKISKLNGEAGVDRGDRRRCSGKYGNVTNITTLSLENVMASKNSKKLLEFLELEMDKRFSEGVLYHVICWTVEQGNMILRDSLPNKMEVNINMFGATMKCRVF